MPLTEANALRAYATMWNTLSIAPIEGFLAEDFTFESQFVFSALESKEAFLEYMTGKLETVGQSDAPAYAEMGTIHHLGQVRPCVLLEQPTKDNLLAVVLAKTNANKLKRLDLCIVPSPQEARRSGEYPT